MDNPPVFLSLSYHLLSLVCLSPSLPLSLKHSYSLTSINTRSANPPARTSSDVPTVSHFGNARHYSPFIGFADFSPASRDVRAMHRDVSRQRPRICNNVATWPIVTKRADA